jgi:hypothetical protein
MSTWGMESYRAVNRPVMADVIEKYAPPLLIANSPALNVSGVAESGKGGGFYSLFPADSKMLRENYVPHWGAVYVAGKQLELPPGAGPLAFDILIAGTYTLETGGPVVIDGARWEPGAYIPLTRGRHNVAAVDGAARRVTLRWGRDLFVPRQPPSSQPIYTAF